MAGQARSNWTEFETTHLDFSHHEIIFKTHTHSLSLFFTCTCTHTQTHTHTHTHTLPLSFSNTNSLKQMQWAKMKIWSSRRMNKNQFLRNLHEIVFSFELEFFFNFHKIVNANITCDHAKHDMMLYIFVLEKKSFCFWENAGTQIEFCTISFTNKTSPNLASSPN